MNSGRHCVIAVLGTWGRETWGIDTLKSTKEPVTESHCRQARPFFFVVPRFLPGLAQASMVRRRGHGRGPPSRIRVLFFDFNRSPLYPCPSHVFSRTCMNMRFRYHEQQLRSCYFWPAVIPQLNRVGNARPLSLETCLRPHTSTKSSATTDGTTSGQSASLSSQHCSHPPTRDNSSLSLRLVGDKDTCQATEKARVLQGIHGQVVCTTLYQVHL
ncbi:hypothetical protein QBC38DRAFT_261003 [Podospora fimiseda]|uniref:Uncharacterized protein n=1 Tax=Podospora fimiseda TaxID=252190 RepID=A0AAN7BYC3_9PEZI|nr:hypothetical protein QBC38DRAFT_261003 [Podospora fimiseda]